MEPNNMAPEGNAPLGQPNNNAAPEEASHSSLTNDMTPSQPVKNRADTGDIILGPPKSQKPLIWCLGILALISLVAAAVFAYLYFTPPNNSQSNTQSQAQETKKDDELDSTLPTVAEVRRLLSEKYKFKEEGGGDLCFSRESIACGMDDFSQESKIQYTIFNIDDSKYTISTSNDGSPLIVKSIKYEELNNQFKDFFGSTEEIEKKDYLFKNAISEVIYRQEDDSFEIKFLDGLGGMSSVEMFNKIVGIKKTENGFSATILRVDFDQAAHSTDPNSVFESSNGTTKLYNILLSDEDKNTIKESLSAYEFRFIDEEGGYKLSSIQKMQ